MKKQKIQLILILVLLIVFGAAYGGMKVYNSSQEEKKSQEEAAAEIYVTETEKEDITAFSYQNNGETLTFVKEDDTWILQDDSETELDQDAVASMLDQITPLKAEDIVESPEDLSEYGFDTPVNVITFTTAEGSTTLTIGMENTITYQYYLTKSNDDTLYLVESSFPSAFEKTAEDLEAAEESTESAVDTTETE